MAAGPKDGAEAYGDGSDAVTTAVRPGVDGLYLKG